MKISYDKEVDAISVTLRKGKVDRTVEISPEIMLDYDVNGNLSACLGRHTPRQAQKLKNSLAGKMKYPHNGRNRSRSISASQPLNTVIQ